MKKTLFIGLGGCGLKTVSILSQKLAALNDPNTKNMYLYIDTDEETLDSINKEGTIIHGEDYIGLGEANPYQIMKQASLGDQPKDKRFLEWATSPGDNRLTFPNERLIDGAQAQRMIGRTAFYQFAETKILPALNSRLAQFKEFQSQDGQTVEADVWVVASSCGGTGSSLTMDMLYLINRLVNDSQRQNPYTKLVLFMPHAFIEQNKGNHNHPLNGMSFLWEFNAFKQRIIDGGGDIFSYFSAYPWRFKDNDNYDLCRFVIPVDTETDYDTEIDLDSIYSTTAEMLYYLNVGDGARRTVSNLSNDIALAKKTFDKLPQYTDTKFKWGTYLIPYGYHVIRKADKELCDYLKKRATFEILSFGLLGEEMTESDQYRKRAKEAFAGEFILPYLCEFQDGITLADDSVQRQLESEFPIWRFNIDDLDAGKVNGFITRVKDAEEVSSEIQGKVLHTIKQSINRGVSESILNHGLRYTYTLLNLVDDYYLEDLNKGCLKDGYQEAVTIVDARLATIKTLLAKGISKKNASSIAKAAEEFRNESLRALAIKISRRIIDDLTILQNGYLEEIRKGSTDKPGIKGLEDLINSKANQAKIDFDSLAKRFLDSEKDALTVYLPSLTEIAGKEGNNWTKDNEFEKIYYASVLDYDRERAKGLDGIRIPVRKNEDRNNLFYFIDQLLKDAEHNLFVDLCLTTKQKAASTLDKLISGVLDEKIKDVIFAEGSSSGQWLKQSLEGYIAANEKSLARKMSLLAKRDKVPVLYPKKPASTQPVMTRFLYVGASDALAKRLGYVPTDKNAEFVQDKSMADRFQIIKMPVGLDFYSYKYFGDLQEAYKENRKQILDEVLGCHLHKAFRTLDLDKAVTEIKEKENINAIRLFFKNLFFQQFILTLKTKNKNTYNNLFGRFEFEDLLAGKEESTAGSDTSFLTQFLGEEPAATTHTILGDDDTRDVFFEYSLQLKTPLGMTVTIYDYDINTENHLVISEDCESFELGDITTPTHLAESILKASSSSDIPMIDWLRKVEMIEKILKQKNGLRTVKDEVKTIVVTPSSNRDSLNFANLLQIWMNKKSMPDHRVYLDAIKGLLKNEL
jgi:hypothetical protein